MPTFVYDNALVPLGNRIQEGRKWTYEQIIVPMYDVAKELITETIPAAFNLGKTNAHVV
jgi:hypothetical protein